jgi:hypothetical protein
MVSARASAAARAARCAARDSAAACRRGSTRAASRSRLCGASSAPPALTVNRTARRVSHAPPDPISCHCIRISSSSTSNTSVALGGIFGGLPVGP